MFAGYVNKRNAPMSPPPMQRVYSVLWGTLLLDFESEEESKTSLTPRQTSEVLGISEWDGQGRGSNSYPNGLLLVTHTGATYYLSTLNKRDREEWVLHIKRALECHFANPEILPFKPSKILLNRPHTSSNMHCPRTKNVLTSSAVFCRSCGRGFSSLDCVGESSTILQLGVEELEKVCHDCKSTQVYVIWFKTLTYLHAMTLHELSPEIGKDIGRYKASFKLRRRESVRLEMAAQLLEEGSISSEEFEELRKVDYEYRRETVMDESEKLKLALDFLGDDLPTIFSLLMNPAATETGGRMPYYQIILKVLEIADRSPELIDFYWPQIIHIHTLESAHRSPSSLMKLDLLQQAMLVMCQKYPALALKLSWSLFANMADYTEKKLTQVQVAASVCLLMQLELAITGNVSTVADVSTYGSFLLANISHGADHQLQELASEIGTLFLVRRRLQEMYDEEEVQRKIRNERNRCDSTENSSKNEADFGSTEPDEHAHFLEMNENTEITEITESTDVKRNSVSHLDKSDVNGVVNSSFQPTLETKTEGSAIIDLNSNLNSNSVNANKSKTDGHTHIPELSPSSTVSLALQHPQEINSAPSCLSLLHKLCVGPANSNRVSRKVEKEVVLNKNTTRINENISSNGSVNKEKFKNESGTERSDVEKRNEEKEHENVLPKLDGKKMKMIEVQKEELKDELSVSVNTASLSSDSIEISFSHTQMELESEGSSSKSVKSASNHIPDDCSDIHENSPVSGRDQPPVSDCEISQKIGFIKQLEFIHKLTDLVEKLRFVDRPLRGDALIKGLKKLNEKTSELGWDPTTIAGEPGYRIIRIIVEECRVFRTKARAPSLIVCEVLREDLFLDVIKSHVNDENKNKNNRYNDLRNDNNNKSNNENNTSDKANSKFDKYVIKNEDDKNSLRVSPRRSPCKIPHTGTNLNLSSDSNDIIKYNSENNNNNNNSNYENRSKHKMDDGVNNLVDQSITAALATMNLNDLKIDIKTKSSALKNKSNPTSPPTISTRKTFDGKECVGFPQNRALSVDDFRITEDANTFSPSFSREAESALRSDNDGNEISSEINGIQSYHVFSTGEIDSSAVHVDKNIISEKRENSENSENIVNSRNNGAVHENESIKRKNVTELNTKNEIALDDGVSPYSTHTQKSLSKKNFSSSLLSANRKSIYNFQTILTSASTDDFSLMTKCEQTSDIFEKTNKLTRRNHAVTSHNSSNNASSNDSCHNGHNSNGCNSDNNSNNNDNSTKNRDKNTKHEYANTGDKSGIKYPGSPRLLPPPFSPRDRKEKITMNGNEEVSVNSIPKKSEISHTSSQDIPKNVPENVPENVLNGIISNNIVLSQSHERTFDSITAAGDFMEIEKDLSDSDDSSDGENAIEKMKQYYDISYSKSEREEREEKEEREEIDSHALNGKFNNSDNGNYGSSNSLNDDEIKSSQNKKDKITIDTSHSRPTTPHFVPTYVSSDDVFRIASALCPKNVTIQACKKLYEENCIIKDEYEKLCRTEINFLEEKTRSEAIAATSRLRLIFGESWSDKKNRILGMNNGHSQGRHRSPIHSNIGNNKNSTVPIVTDNKIIINTNINANLSTNTNVNTNTNIDNNNKVLSDSINKNGGISIESNNTPHYNLLASTYSDDESDGDEDDYWPERNVISFIVKSNDDLRQEVCCLQLMQICDEIFTDYDLKNQLYLRPYRIVSTGNSTGLVQVLSDTLSLDALKKTIGFTSLPNYFKKTFGTSSERLIAAKRNFASSLAGYSLFCYILQIKDRHNGNLLIDQEGHIIHIDFGFMLSIAPGGSFSLESAPFKLTEEMVEVLGGLESVLFGLFVKAFTSGFLALRTNIENIISNLKLLAINSPFPCFSGKDSVLILEKLRGRFRCDLSLKDTVEHCLDLIIASYGHYGTKQYDSFQWYTNGIMP